MVVFQFPFVRPVQVMQALRTSRCVASGFTSKSLGWRDRPGSVQGERGNRALLWFVLRAPAGRGSAPEGVHGHGRTSGLGWI